MGSCASSHKHKDSVESNGIKFQNNSFGSKSDNLLFSPVKPNGSKEEAFFDSKGWFDSDCDEDFMSVNGEFTPSRGNTPLHHSFAITTPQVNKALVEGPARGGPVPNQLCPSEKKMRLSDLFSQSFRVKHDADDEQNTSDSPTDTTCSSSLHSSERTPSGNFKARREKSLWSLQCCLPNRSKRVTLLKETR